MKIALLAVVRFEGDIYEWIDYHLYNVKFEHIYIIDNNPIEYPIIIFNPKVTVIKDTTTMIHNGSIQPYMYNKVIPTIVKDGYTHLGVCDIDEYFDFNGKTVQEYLSMYPQYNAIEIPWFTYSDSDNITIQPVHTSIAYTRPTKQQHTNWNCNEYSWGKPIFKIEKGITMSVHWPNNFTYSDGPITRYHEDSSIARVRHYRTKSLQNYMQKVAYRKFKGSPCVYNRGSNIVRAYFDFNEVTKQKVSMFQTLANLYNITLSTDELETLKTLKLQLQ